MKCIFTSIQSSYNKQLSNEPEFKVAHTVHSNITRTRCGMKSILLDHFFIQLLAGGLLKLWHMYCTENSIVHIANYSSLLTEVATPILLMIPYC